MNHLLIFHFLITNKLFRNLCTGKYTISRIAKLRYATLVALMFHAGISGAGQPSAKSHDTPLVTGLPNLPADARWVAERLASRNHFAGEINGDGGKRDKEVSATLTELSCDTIERGAEPIRRKYAAD